MCVRWIRRRFSGAFGTLPTQFTARHAETKDHLDWELIGKCADKLEGEARQLLMDAYLKVEDEEDEHVYHTKGWCRELWIESLGLKAILPPPEEVRDVRDALGAAEAEQSAPARR